MAKVIIYTRPDGGVSVIYPASIKGLSEDEVLQRAMARSVPTDALNVKTLDQGVIPTDRTFRNAWSQINARVTVDMIKAKDIWRAKLRDARAPLLAKLDVDYQRADEGGNAQLKKDIAAQKQILRDLTADPKIDQAQTPDDLKALWPSALLGDLNRV